MGVLIALNRPGYWLAISVTALLAFAGVQKSIQTIRAIKTAEAPSHKTVQLGGDTDTAFAVNFNVPDKIYEDDNAEFEVVIFRFEMSRGDASHQNASVELSAVDFEFSPSDKIVVPVPPPGQMTASTLLIKPRSSGEKKILVRRSSDAKDFVTDVVNVRVLPPIKALGMTAAQLDILKTICAAIGLPSIGALLLGLWQKYRDSGAATLRGISTRRQSNNGQRTKGNKKRQS